MTQLLTLQLSELKAERTILLDRLALIGLGGTLFSSPSLQDSSLTTEPEEDLIDPQEKINEILALRRRPSLMAQAIKQQAVDEMKRRSVGPDVKWIPINAALDEAEKQGRQQAK